MCTLKKYIWLTGRHIGVVMALGCLITQSVYGTPSEATAESLLLKQLETIKDIGVRNLKSEEGEKVLLYSENLRLVTKEENAAYTIIQEISELNGEEPKVYRILKIAVKWQPVPGKNQVRTLSHQVYLNDDKPPLIEPESKDEPTP